MKTCCFGLLLLAASLASAQAGFSLGPWNPIFKGIDHAVGTNVPDGTTPITRLQVAHVARVDLTDPDIQFFTTPQAPGYLEGSRETLSLTLSNFVRNYGLQLAVDANFYNPSDPSGEGQATTVDGLFISRGIIVSHQEQSTETSVLMFTTNKQPVFVFDNQPPGTNTAGIYTAVCGHYPLIISGQSVANDSTSPIPGENPRTAFGVDDDSHYLYLLTIDGRQSGYSQGALDSETVYWLQQLGVYNAINMDGGGSTGMDMADCSGNAINLNRSSVGAARNHERYIGAHFGVYAKPLAAAVGNPTVEPYDTTAIIKWTTPVPANAYVEFGISGGPTRFSATNSNLLKKHVVTLNGLTANTRYDYHIHSESPTAGSFLYDCGFTTTNFPVSARSMIFDFTNRWRFTTNNLDGVNWMARDYNDSGWSGPSPGLLYIEGGPTYGPKSTFLPPSPNGAQVPGISPTYYFRTHFNFPRSPQGVTLFCTNSVDDGAAFYLNGNDLFRTRMEPAPAVLTYTTLTYPTAAQPCQGDANCAEWAIITGSVLTNLVSGDNVLAAEVHQSAAVSQDIVFGCVLAYSQNVVPSPTLQLLQEGTVVTLYWNGSGFVLQYADDPAGTWTDVPGPVTSSTYTLAGSSGSRFYRLRN